MVEAEKNRKLNSIYSLKALVYELFDMLLLFFMVNSEGHVPGYRFWMYNLSVESQMFVFLSRRLSCRIDHIHQFNVFHAGGNSGTVLQVCVRCPHTMQSCESFVSNLGRV